MQMSGLRADASAGWVFGALDELIPRQVWSADPHIGRDSSTACPVSQGKRTSPVLSLPSWPVRGGTASEPA
jgi:hypothetical protein